VIPIIQTIVFIVLAAAWKAVADTLKDHYDTSIFRNKDPRFWKPDISWQYVGYIKFTKYHPDAWHISNSFMIAFFDGAIVSISTLTFHWKWYWYVAEFFAIGFFFMIIFNLFYDHLLKKKS
jgi:hypothetical protein